MISGGHVFCPNCGNETGENQVFCHQCGARLASAETAPSGEAPGRTKTPWEDREHTGALHGFIATLKSVLFAPAIFFRNMRVQGGLTDPLLYAMIVGMLGLMFLFAWNMLLPDPLRSVTTEFKTAAGGDMSANFATPGGAAMTPFLLILWIFIASGMLHLFLMIVHGAKAGFEATFRVVCFSLSPFLFMLVPYCGTLVAMIWILTLVVIGLRDAHETSGGKATVAVLFPLLCCCGIFALAVLLIMGAAAASIGAMMHLYR